MIASVDEFILYDDMQYTRRDWRNRNLIKTPQGLQWVTVPVRVKGKFHQTIRETEIDGTAWMEDHWRAFQRNYAKAAHYQEVSEQLAPLYRGRGYELLSDLNRTLIEWVCGYLGINTKLSNSWDYRSVEGKTERLVDICVRAEADEYVSGPAARNYIDESQFAQQGIKLTWFDYSGYPEYPQLWGEFEHGVTILDLLFNCGPDAVKYMKHT